MSDFEIDVNESCLSDHPFIIQEFDELTAGVFNVLSYSASSIKPNFSKIPDIHDKLKEGWGNFQIPADKPSDFKDFYKKWKTKTDGWVEAGTLMNTILTSLGAPNISDQEGVGDFDAFWGRSGIFSKIATGAFGGFKFDVLEGPNKRVEINKDVLGKLQKSAEPPYNAVNAVNGISGKDEYLTNMITEFFKAEDESKPKILVCPEFDFIEVLEALGGPVVASGGKYQIHTGIPLVESGLECVLVGEWGSYATGDDNTIDIPKFMEARAGTGQPKTNSCRVIFYKNMTLSFVTPLETPVQDKKKVSLSKYKLDAIKFNYRNGAQETDLTCYAVHAKSLMPVGKKKMEEMTQKVTEMNAFNNIIKDHAGQVVGAKGPVLYLGDFNYPMVTDSDGAIASSHVVASGQKKETPVQYELGSFKEHIKTLGLSTHPHAAYAGAILKSRVWDFINEQLSKAMDKNEYRKYGSDFIFFKGLTEGDLYDIRTVNDMKKWNTQTDHTYLKAPTTWRSVEFPATPEANVVAGAANRRENVFYPYFYKQQSRGSPSNRVILAHRNAVARTLGGTHAGGRRLRSRRSRRRRGRRTQKRNRSLRKRRSLRRRRGRRSRRM